MIVCFHFLIVWRVATVQNIEFVTVLKVYMNLFVTLL
jgi:hypothetical protein